MKYTAYLSQLLKSQSAPHFDSQAFAKVMNVHLEGKIAALNELKQKERMSDLKHKYDVEIFSNREKLKELTKYLEPEAFFKTLFDKLVINEKMW